MTVPQFLARLKKSGLPAVALLIGPEAYQRRQMKQALTAPFPPEAVTTHDLAEVSLADVLDDARALSLFAAERLIWVINAEAALPRGRAAEADGESGAAGEGDPAPLSAYVKDPTPGVALVFEASRFDFEGDDKRKLERVAKFYSAIPETVELRRLDARSARLEAERLAAAAGARLDAEAFDLLVESLGADMSRIAVEIEKLALYAGDRPVGVEDIAALVPDARAIQHIRAGECAGPPRPHPGARNPRHPDARRRVPAAGPGVPLHAIPHGAGGARSQPRKARNRSRGIFRGSGVPMWGSRAEQVHQTVTRFSRPQLERAIKLIFEADRGMRDTRPDDRIVMERFILALAGNQPDA